MPNPNLVLNEFGLMLPSYDDYRNYLIEQFKSLYGNDIYLEADSQDGQLISIFALALYDTASICAKAYHSFAPDEAIGTGLSRLVNINGITRHMATLTTVDVKIIGQYGTIIKNGVVEDVLRNKYNLPGVVTIPKGGEIIVTATAQNPGEIRIMPGELTKIVSPTRGWHSVENISASTPGNPIESDSDLRIRRKKSVALPALSVNEAIVGAILNVNGVTRIKYYENPTGSTDSNGLPPHSICAVVEGGNSDTIAKAIRLKKTPGTATHGDVTVPVADSMGLVTDIKFFRPTLIPVQTEITLKGKPQYTSVIGSAICHAVSKYIDGLAIGDDVLVNRLYGVVFSADTASRQSTFDIQQIRLKKEPDAYESKDIKIGYNCRATATFDDVEIILN